MKKIKKAIIPAAGLGTRFLPATIAQPKEMLIVVDKPVIQYVVEEAAAAGIEEILIVIGRNKRSIEDHFDPPLELEETLRKKNKTAQLAEIQKIAKLAHLHFIRQNKQLGLADAIYYGRYFVGDEPFAVLLGDTIITSDNKESCLFEMSEIFATTGQAVVGGEYLKRIEDVERYGIIDFDKTALKTAGGIEYFQVNDLVEKPSIKSAPSRLAVSARYIFTPDIFKYIEQTKPGKGGEIQITDSMRLLVKNEGLLTYQMNGRRYDIGNKIDYIKTNIEFALENDETKSEIREFVKKIRQ